MRSLYNDPQGKKIFTEAESRSTTNGEFMTAARPFVCNSNIKIFEQKAN